MTTRWDRFFEALRRFNIAAAALAILGLGAVAVVGVGLLAASALFGGGPRALVASAVDAGRSSSEPLKTGAFRPMADTGLYWASIERRGRLKGVLDSYAAAGVIDHHIYDPESGETRALFGPGDRLLLETWHLSWDPDDESEDPRVVALVSVSVDRDANGDGRLTNRDGGSVLIGRPDGREMTAIARGAPVGAHLLSPETAVFFVRDPETGAGEAVHVDVARLEAVRRDPIPAPQAAP